MWQKIKNLFKQGWFGVQVSWVLYQQGLWSKQNFKALFNHPQGSFWLQFLRQLKAQSSSLDINQQRFNTLTTTPINAQHTETLNLFLSQGHFNNPLSNIYFDSILSLTFPKVFGDILNLLTNTPFLSQPQTALYLNQIKHHRAKGYLHIAILTLNEAGLLSEPQGFVHFEALLNHKNPSKLANAIIEIFNAKHLFKKLESKIYTILYKHPDPQDLASYLIRLQKKIPTFIFEYCFKDIVQYWPHLRGTPTLKDAWRHIKDDDIKEHLGELLELCQHHAANLEVAQQKTYAYLQNHIINKVLPMVPPAHSLTGPKRMFRPKVHFEEKSQSETSVLKP